MGEYQKNNPRKNNYREQEEVPSYPAGYLETGYFRDAEKNIKEDLLLETAEKNTEEDLPLETAEKNIKEDLLLETAEKVAKAIGYKKGTSSAQLNRFYRHAKSVQVNMEQAGNYIKVKDKILSLMGAAAEAKGKRKVNESFYLFIKENIDQIKYNDDPDYFMKGFMKHFEAVVAYYYFYYPKN